MKKLIAISVMIALVAGAVFADTSVSGGIEARLKLVDAEFGDHGAAYANSFPKPKAGGDFGAAHIQLSGANADGTLNGLFRLRNVDMVRSDMWFHRVFINWKPVDLMNIFVGIDNDGKFATDALEGWAFHQGSDDYIHFQWWDYWRAVFPGNWDGFGAAVSLYPVSGVDINLILPFGGTGWPQATNATLSKTHNVGDIYTSGYRLQANIAIPDIGRIMVSYKGPYNNNHFGGNNKYNKSFMDDSAAYGAFGVSFLLNGLVDGLQAHVGFATDNIPAEYAINKGVKKVDASGAVVEEDIEDTLPLYFGAAAHFATGDFGIKFRVGATLNFDYQPDHFFLTGNLMPWYNLGVMAAYLDFGVSLDKPNADADMDMGFWVNPYVKVPISGGYFQVGFSIRQNINGHGNVSVLRKDDTEDGKPVKDAAGNTVKIPDGFTRFDLPMIIGFNF